jgi:hypothetical protein
MWLKLATIDEFRQILSKIKSQIVSKIKSNFFRMFRIRLIGRLTEQLPAPAQTCPLGGASEYYGHKNTQCSKFKRHLAVKRHY